MFRAGPKQDVGAPRLAQVGTLHYQELLVKQIDLKLLPRTGSTQLRSSQAYPRGFGDFVARKQSEARVVAASIQREDASLRCRCKAALTSWTRFGIRFAPCVLLACASCRFWVCHVIWDQGICAGTELEKGRPLVFKQPSHDMVACKRPKWFSPCGPNEQPCTPGHLPRAVGIDICLHVGGHYPNLVFLLGVGPTPRWHQFVLSPMIQIPGSPAGADRVLLQGGWPWRSAGQDPATSSL